MLISHLSHITSCAASIGKFYSQSTLGKTVGEEKKWKALLMISQIVIRFLLALPTWAVPPLMGFRCRFFNGNKLLVEDFANRNEGPDGSAYQGEKGKKQKDYLNDCKSPPTWSLPWNNSVNVPRMIIERRAGGTCQDTSGAPSHKSTYAEREN